MFWWLSLLGLVITLSFNPNIFFIPVYSQFLFLVRMRNWHISVRGHFTRMRFSRLSIRQYPNPVLYRSSAHLHYCQNRWDSLALIKALSFIFIMKYPYYDLKSLYNWASCNVFTSWKFFKLIFSCKTRIKVHFPFSTIILYWL
jgi:hypothetical protein